MATLGTRTQDSPPYQSGFFPFTQDAIFSNNPQPLPIDYKTKIIQDFQLSSENEKIFGTNIQSYPDDEVNLDMEDLLREVSELKKRVEALEKYNADNALTVENLNKWFPDESLSSDGEPRASSETIALGAESPSLCSGV